MEKYKYTKKYLLLLSLKYTAFYNDLVFFLDIRDDTSISIDYIMKVFNDAGKKAVELKKITDRLPDDFKSYDKLMECHCKVIPHEFEPYVDMYSLLKKENYFKHSSETVMRNRFMELGDPFYYDDVAKGYDVMIKTINRCWYEYEMLKILRKPFESKVHL